MNSSKRYVIRLAYEGTAFKGFAPNEGVPTVGQTLRDALETFFQHPIPITCAGRTDAGVHALEQVVHFETPKLFDVGLLRHSLNGMCRPHIVVASVREAPDGFDARYSALRRRYRYRILNRRVGDPFRRRYVWHLHEPLDVGAMDDAAQHLIGVHDFTSFCRKQFVTRTDTGLQHEKSRMRDVIEVSWFRCEGPGFDDEIWMEIEANSFCQQMVRSIAGLCVDVGLSKLRPDEVADILSARDRTAVARVAPPQGLFLLHVTYDPPLIA